MTVSSFEEAVGFILDHALHDIYTCMPARVIAIRQQDMSVDVQPLLSRLYSDNTVSDRPTIFNVPLQMPGTDTSLVYIPVQIGNIVMLFFSMRGLDNFKAGAGTPAAPSDYRIFDKRDAIAVPGLFPFSRSPVKKFGLGQDSNSLSISNNIGTPKECTIVAKSDGSVSMKNTSTGSVSLSATGEVDLIHDPANYVKVTPAGVTILGVSVLINGVDFSTHPHSGVTPGTGVSGPPV